jgi:hypothetical protein
MKPVIQHIGKIDGVEKAVISYYDICNFGEMRLISIYLHLADIWSSGKI